MNALENLEHLNHKITVYVPSTVDVDKQADTREWQTRTAEVLSVAFGGATSTKGFGYWVSESGETIGEDVTMIYSFCSDADFNNHIDSVYNFCKEMCKELKQEAVSLEVDNALYFVEAKKKER